MHRIVPCLAACLAAAAGAQPVSTPADLPFSVTAAHTRGVSGAIRHDNAAAPERLTAAWEFPEAQAVDDLWAAVDLGFTPDFWWAPHLTPEEGDVIARHAFRSPAIIVVKDGASLAFVPDLDAVAAHPEFPWYLDFDARSNRIVFGLSEVAVPEHVRFVKKPGFTVPAGRVELPMFVLRTEAKDGVADPFGPVSRFLWERWGKALYDKGEPGTVPLDRYVERTYAWAFGSWEKASWQEFDLDGKRVGAPTFIVNFTQSPNYAGPEEGYEFRSIWNQAWFSSLRSASGVMRYGQRTGNEDLKRRARMTRDFALAAPQRDGIFPTVYRTENERVTVEGKELNRWKGWETGYWTNSNRVPRNYGVTDAWYNVLDMSWTALLLLRWDAEIEKDERIRPYAQRYGDALLRLQDADGHFPSWLHPETLEPSPILAQSPQTSMSVTFLLALAEATGEARYREAALKAMDAVVRDIIPEGRWEDYETYWSCCGFWNDRVGEKIPRNGMYKQNTLSPFWTAEALLRCYETTYRAGYLDWGRRTLHELSLFQQSWQPPFIYIPALGGFGVMNYDGEWNDARQSLFAELFLDYYRATGEPMLFERGVAAMKASFVMMYCPENPAIKPLWEKVHPHFGPEDYGFMMENYGHGGTTSPEGDGVGPFTIYDWGNGAASEAWSRIRAHYGDVYIDTARNRAFGIDSVRAERRENGWFLRALGGETREVRVVFDRGAPRTVALGPDGALVSLSPEASIP